MKKPVRSALAMVASLPLAAMAFQDGGFTGPDGRKPPVTAAEAVALPDDTSVRIVGYIVRSLGDERYEFSDDSGTLVVEIDDDDWEGVEVTPNDRVELAGEVDHEGPEIEIDVDSVRLAP